VAALFPGGTFVRGKPDFSFVCENTSPRQGVRGVQREVVSGRWAGITPGMRAWASLGWYRLASLALMRGHCCAAPPELVWAFELPCPMDESMKKVEQAARADDDEAMKVALEEFRTHARCLAKAGLGANFNLRGYPGPGEPAFKKMLERMRAAQPK
jgi:hypothetical protein